MMPSFTTAWSGELLGQDGSKQRIITAFFDVVNSNVSSETLVAHGRVLRSRYLDRIHS